MAVVNQVGNALTGSTGTGSFVGATSPTLVTPVLGAASATSLSFSSTSGIIGTTTNDNAAAGSVGELISSEIAFGSAIALTTLTPTNITSISLTAGDWDLWGNIYCATAGATNTTVVLGWLDATSATIPSTQFVGVMSYGAAGLVNVDTAFVVPSRRYSLSATTTIYLSVYTAFTVSTLSGFGNIYARRRR